jgi:hypothetical protein
MPTTKPRKLLLDQRALNEIRTLNYEFGLSKAACARAFGVARSTAQRYLGNVASKQPYEPAYPRCLKKRETFTCFGCGGREVVERAISGRTALCCATCQKPLFEALSDEKAQLATLCKQEE